MTTDNVLVSREKLKEALQAVKHYIETIQSLEDTPWFTALVLSEQSMIRDAVVGLKHTLAMPDFIESQQDVDVVKSTVYTIIKHGDDTHKKWLKDKCGEVAQAAINALKYRKEGE